MKSRKQVPIATLEIIIPELEDAPDIKPPKRPWTPREEAILERYYGYKDPDLIARSLKRSKNAVQFKARQMGISMFRDQEDPR